MQFLNNVKNLNNAWVVVKVYNGKTYFYRQGYNDTQYASSAVVFFDRDDAAAAAIKRNANRQRVKYFVEPASKHFVNGWQVDINWYENTLGLKNPPLPIQDITSKRRNVILPSEIKASMQDAIKKIIAQIDASMQATQARYDESMTKYKQQKESMQQFVATIDNTNFEELLKPFSTGAEQTLKILYEDKK